MDAVVLAGGQIPAALQGATDATERALIPIAGKPALLHVIDELRTVTPVTRIICVTTPGAREILPSDIECLPSGDKLTANLFAGVHAAKSDQILVVTGDVPLATGRTWMQFLDGAAVNVLEAAYPIVSREKIEVQFPGGKRTYAPLKDGSFTGGNGFLLPRQQLPQFEKLIEDAFAARKNPFALAKMMGYSFIFKALARQLTINEIEMKVSRMLGARCGAVIVPDASIAFDVDKPEDLQLAEKVVNERKNQLN